VNSIPSSDGNLAILPGLRLKLADGSIDAAELGGARAASGKGLKEPDPTWGLMVTDWRNNAPYMRSKDNDFGGPGSPEGRQSYVVSGGKPAPVRNPVARKWAWNENRLVNLILNNTSMLVLDRHEPVGSYTHVRKDIQIGVSMPKVGRPLAHITLAGKVVKNSSPYGNGGFDPVAMILAGDQAIAAWTFHDSKSDVHFRPEATVQFVDIVGGTITSEITVRPGVIEHGMATGQGRLFLSLDDGSLVAYE